MKRASDWAGHLLPDVQHGREPFTSKENCRNTRDSVQVGDTRDSVEVGVFTAGQRCMNAE